MSGHSKWATIKHKKGAADKARGKLFNKLARQIEVAAKNGGDIDTNPTLRTAVQKAKAGRMTNDAIDRAIKRGTGDADGGTYESIMYEGYAPGGVALMIDVLTDNRNRTGSEIRNVFSKLGGSMAEPGAVGWQFGRRGVILTGEGADEEKVMMVAIEAGADDVIAEGDGFRIMTDPHRRLRREDRARQRRYRGDLRRLADGVGQPRADHRPQGREGGAADPRGARGQRRRAGRVLQLRHQRRLMEAGGIMSLGVGDARSRLHPAGDRRDRRVATAITPGTRSCSCSTRATTRRCARSS